MTEINTATEAGFRAKDHLMQVNGMLNVVMFQTMSIISSEEGGVSVWVVKCNYYTNMTGNERVKKELHIRKSDGEVIGEKDLNGGA